MSKEKGQLYSERTQPQDRSTKRNRTAQRRIMINRRNIKGEQLVKTKVMRKYK